MRLVRWLLWQVIMVPVSLLFLLAAVLLAMLSLAVPVLRLLKLALSPPERERSGLDQLWREPRLGFWFLRSSFGSVVEAHRVRIGEI